MDVSSLQATVDFEVHYIPPEDAFAAFDMLEDDQQMLMDIEQNIANIERNLASATPEVSIAHDRRMRTMKRATTVATGPTPGQDKRKSTLKSMRSLIR